ncbi:methyl-accepting chemotaxis protein [Rhodopseudomonas pseudopalustris]|uniref:methyl-accepting chemotaxis protein n=1 Tax=Rhodopseudomonas pseudopalustris TaxID=1513892 RepID=UPI003F94F57B
MTLLGNFKIVFKVGLIVASLALQMAGQIWFASIRMEKIDESYADVVRRLDKFALVNARAAGSAEEYIAHAFQLAAEGNAQGAAKYVTKIADDRRTYETQMAEVLKNLPEHAAAIEPVVGKVKKAFQACDPAIGFAAKAASPEDSIKASYRLKEECVPPLQDALATQHQLIADLSVTAAKAADALTAQTESTIFTTYVTAAIGLLLNLAFAMWIGIAGLSHPIDRLKKAMQALAQNDLSVDVPGKESRDEIGDMARTVEVFKNNALEVERLKQQQLAIEERAAAERKADMERLANNFEASVGEVIQTVTTAAAELESAARSLTSTAEREEHLASTVAAASEQATANVQSVASATEQMTSSVNEISRRVQESANIAHQAVDQAKQTNDRIGALATAAGRIGDIIDLINNIAGQTNLLALNATIEAARAGDAGRGFAVVASEVKALAEQTGKATDEISQQIAGMQSATQESVTAIREIGSTIERMSEISSSIASAVEEQGAATQEIARNVQEAAKGTSQVSNSITDVQQGANETGTASARVLSAAQSLSRDSSRLRSEVGNFLDTVRAA